MKVVKATKDYGGGKKPEERFSAAILVPRVTYCFRWMLFTKRNPSTK
jgi:hypothetical protein